MNTYDVVCPICGTVTYSLYLEETGGLGGVRKLWEPDTISLDGAESKANPSIYNPKIAGTERTCRVKCVWKGGYILAT